MILKNAKDANGAPCEVWIKDGAVSYTHLTLPTNSRV